MADSFQTELKIKLLIIGESKVGKTCLINSYVTHTFNVNQLSTVGLDFRTKKLKIQDKQVNLSIYDTAGQERFRNLATGYMKSADGFLVCFDITSESTLEKANYWVESIRNTARKNVQMLIIGNKCDLEEEREVTFEQGEKFAADNNTIYLETSSKQQIGVDKAFETLVTKILHQKKIEEGGSDKNESTTNSQEVIQLNKPKKKETNKKKSFC